MVLKGRWGGPMNAVAIKRIALFGLVAAVLVAAGPTACKYAWRGLEGRLALTHVPKPLHVTRILYRVENVEGVGPGGNETGLIVYELPIEAARQIEAGGMAFVSQLNVGERNRPWYYNWAQTPSKRWCDAHRKTDWANIQDFLGRWGHPISLRADVLHSINGALNSDQNYFACGKGGSLLILVPRERRVYFAYSG